MNSKIIRLALFSAIGIAVLGITGRIWLRNRNEPRQSTMVDLPKSSDAMPVAPHLPTHLDKTTEIPVAAAVPSGPPAVQEPTSRVRDLQADMVRVEDFVNAGRATPAAAFQTFIWAALKGDDDELAGTLVLGDAAREKALDWRAALPAESREKYATLEKLPGLFLAEEIVRKAATAQILGTVDNGPDRVIVRVRTGTLVGTTGTSKFPMKRTDDGWGLEIPEDMIEGMRKMSAESDAGTAPPLAGK